MEIAQLVDEIVMDHIGMHGCIKNADPFVQHMVKHSQHPILRFRRWWMRSTALRQRQEAEKRQVYISDNFKNESKDRTKTMRRTAMIDPYFMAEMSKRHNASWNDKGFRKSVREANPSLFPKRT